MNTARVCVQYESEYLFEQTGHDHLTNCSTVCLILFFVAQKIFSTISRKL